METIIKTTTISGCATFSRRPYSFSFFPDEPEQGKVRRYRKNGTAIQTSDGTFEFIQRNFHRSRATVIKRLSHGRLSKTVAGDYLLTIRVSETELSPVTIIADNALVAMDALQSFIFREEVA